MEPIRTCIGCRKRLPQSRLMRFALDEHGELRLDYRAPARTGRGAWLCPRSACLTKALKRKGFSRAFRQKVGMPNATALRDAIDASLTSAVRAALKSARRIEADAEVPEAPDSGVFVWGQPPARWVLNDRVRSRSLARALDRYRTWNDGLPTGQHGRQLVANASGGAREDR